MTRWPSELFAQLAISALVFYVFSLLEQWATPEKAPAQLAPAQDASEDDDEHMDDPLWLEIADAAEDFLHRGDTLSRHRLERALEAVEC